jgi:hypothetical protein
MCELNNLGNEKHNATIPTSSIYFNRVETDPPPKKVTEKVDWGQKIRAQFYPQRLLF